jgi:pyrroline-5-carboxylate reductase
MGIMRFGVVAASWAVDEPERSACCGRSDCRARGTECVTVDHAWFAWPPPLLVMAPAYTGAMSVSRLAFIGGGNMAGAIFGGLLRSGWTAAAISVVEPWAEQRARLAAAHPGVQLLAAADASLAAAEIVVWAVKPQNFAEAAAPCAAHVGGALHLSVMAGIRSEVIAQATGSQRVVRAMPNTPALIGRGIAGLFARPAVGMGERSAVERVLAPTGQLLWLDREADLDAVTALSGSGPAYVFYFIEAMMQAAAEMGLSDAQGRALALATFAGATALAAQSDEAPAVLRERVTSKGGTTQAALTALEASGVKAAFVQALHAARRRAEELGR